MPSYAAVFAELRLASVKRDPIRTATWEARLVFCGEEERIFHGMRSFLRERSLVCLVVHVLRLVLKSVLKLTIICNPRFIIKEKKNVSSCIVELYKHALLSCS